jgi:hypothetical protein
LKVDFNNDSIPGMVTVEKAARFVRQPVLGLSLLLLAAACSADSAGSSSGDSSGVFVAYAQNFNGFHSWSSAPATSKGGVGDGLHGAGPLRVYWNENPPHGSMSFPVGTIIVKETEEADVTQRTIFAMAKRGGAFNSGGANGWEWFSLQNNADGSVEWPPLWRGPIAPGTETYASQPIGDCNGCHEQAVANDYVWDTALQLSHF